MQNMLGLILIYIIGKNFYDLASKNKKNKWGYAVLGVLSYYIGSIIIGGFGMVILELFFSNFLNTSSSILLELLLIPFGLLICWSYYKHLEKSFLDELNNVNRKTSPDILDDDFF